MPDPGYQLAIDNNGGSYLLHPSRTAASNSLRHSGLTGFTMFGGMINDEIGSGASPNYYAFSLVHVIDDGMGATGPTDS